MMKQKACNACRTLFTPQRIGQRSCSVKCAIESAKSAREATNRKKTALAKVELRSRRDWLKLAQVAYNSFIRERDKGQPCISCGAPLVKDSNGGGYDCGHYRSIGSAPHLRYHPNNAAGQCKKCNRYGSGMAVDYRIRLIKRIGLEAVESLDADQEVRKYTIEELKEIIAEYKAKTKELRTQDKKWDWIPGGEYE